MHHCEYFNLKQGHFCMHPPNLFAGKNNSFPRPSTITVSLFIHSSTHLHAAQGARPSFPSPFLPAVPLSFEDEKWRVYEKAKISHRTAPTNHISPTASVRGELYLQVRNTLTPLGSRDHVHQPIACGALRAVETAAWGIDLCER